MRLSADTASPFFVGLQLCAEVDDPWDVRVFIDGVQSDLVVEADSVEGWADTLVRDPDGKLQTDGDEDSPRAKVVRVTARVEFRIGETVLT